MSPMDLPKRRRLVWLSPVLVFRVILAVVGFVVGYRLGEMFMQWVAGGGR